MAQIPRAALDYVTEQINGLSADAQVKVLKVLQAIDWKPDDADNIAACRQAVVEALASILPTYTDAAAQAGADLYDAVREASVGERLGAQSISGYNQDAVAGAVRAFVQDIVVGDMVDVFNRKVLDRVDYEVRRAENVSVAKNAARDPLKPKYARVPSGSETCGFCLMLSSFGFHYNSESSAGHAHANCDCRVIPDFGGASVEGYDPDDMYRNYNRCLETLGGRDGIREQWMKLPDDERAKRIERHGGKESDAFESFLNGRIAAEIETRDPAWFRTGKTPEISFETAELESEIKKNRPHEIRTAERIRLFGIRADFVVDHEGSDQPKGLADLANGYELKYVFENQTYNTTNDHLKRTSKKRGARYVCFDNADGNMPDGSLVENILRSRSFRRGRVYIIDSDGNYRFIR